MDPERIIHAPDAPPELLELVRGLAPPPELRPALRAEIDREIARRTVWHGGWLGPGLGVAVALSVAAGVLYVIASSETMHDRSPAEAIELRSIPPSEMLEPPQVAPSREAVGHAPDQPERRKPRPRDAVPRNLGQGPTPPSGPLDRDSIARVVAAQRTSLQQCGTATGIRDGSAVRVAAEITIQPSGRVANVNASSPGPHAAAILPCIETKIRTWVFPRSSTPMTVRVPIVITFPSAPAPDTPANVTMEQAPTMERVVETRERQARERTERERLPLWEGQQAPEPEQDQVAACANEGVGDPMSRCIVRTVRPVGQRNLRALAMAHRTLGDRANACRTMRLYVDRYGSTSAANEFRQYMSVNCL